MPALASRVITVTIERPLDRVCAVLADPSGWPLWAAGLAGGLERRPDGLWAGRGPGGGVTVRFSAPNDYGIFDHWVTLENGQVVYVPVRAVAAGDGAEVQLTLFRQPQMSEAEFARDADLVRRDLDALKALIEGA